MQSMCYAITIWKILATFFSSVSLVERVWEAILERYGLNYSAMDGPRHNNEITIN